MCVFYCYTRCLCVLTASEGTRIAVTGCFIAFLLQMHIATWNALLGLKRELEKCLKRPLAQHFKLKEGERENVPYSNLYQSVEKSYLLHSVLDWCGFKRLAKDTIYLIILLS